MKKNVALLTGGFTRESVVSLKSAKQIESVLDADRYQVFKIIIDVNAWYYVAENQQHIPIDKNDFSLTVNGKKVNFDVAFIIIHGSPGEDGKLQGYFDLLGIPYTTCDATTSALTMNKGYTKAVVAGINNLNVAASLQLFGQNDTLAHEIKSQLKVPLFIKPNNGGSSIGMSKVNEWYALNDALTRAFAEDDQILVEEFIRGREFTVGIYKARGEVVVLPITEVQTSKEFFDYEAKYTTGVTVEITPADLTAEQVEKIGDIAKAVFYKLNCKGMVRIDFILQDFTDDFYFIEINTVPGQVETSFIPQQVKAAGMEMKEFYGLLIEEALN